MFVKTIKLAPSYPDALSQAVIAEWEKRQTELHKDDVNIDTRISELRTQAKMTVDKIKFLTSEVAIKYMEQDLVKIEEQVTELLNEKEKTEDNKPMDIKVIMAYIKYFLEHRI